MKRSYLSLITVCTVLLFSAFSCEDILFEAPLKNSQWRVNTISLSGVQYPDLEQDYILHLKEDMTFRLQLDVNVTTGNWEVDGAENIHFSDCMSTEICCDSEAGNALKSIMPEVISYIYERNHLRLMTVWCTVEFSKVD